MTIGAMKDLLMDELSCGIESKQGGVKVVLVLTEPRENGRAIHLEGAEVGRVGREQW